MQKAILIHNPTAGNGKHSKDQLKELIENTGYEVEYFSTDVPRWEHFVKNKPDIFFVAGGDGTVQKLAKLLLNKGGEMQHVPVQVLPLGTANNIAETLGINTEVENLLKCQNRKGFDTGQLKGPGETKFFIEGMGFGVFPKLIKMMKAREEEEGEIGDPTEELSQSLEELFRIVEGYEADEGIIIADKEEIVGKFLLVELMNIRFIGPNFELAPHARPGDGFFELVAVREEAREDLKAYVKALITGSGPLKTVEEFALLKKVKEVRFKWNGHDVHIDDDIIEDYRGEEIVVKNRQSDFTFLQ